jgi:hypothetical protein
MDIDECAINNGGCSHTCQNTLGGSNCLCPPGFMLGNDWKSCKGAQFSYNFIWCLYGNETWSLTLREEHALGAKEIFGSKWEDIRRQ